jgi:hypothetical protein
VKVPPHGGFRRPSRELLRDLRDRFLLEQVKIHDGRVAVFQGVDRGPHLGAKQLGVGRRGRLPHAEPDEVRHRKTLQGSKQSPYATLAKAVAAADGAPIYACAETFTEATALKSDTTFYGGLDCANAWAYVGSEKKTLWTATADAVPLHLVAGARVALEDFAISAADAGKAGGSSIAVLAEVGTKLRLAQCDVAAGNGAPGENGTAEDMPAASGVDGNAGGEACSGNMIFGGGEAVNACDPNDPNDDSIGGSGGIGQTSSGGDGSDGQPDGTANGGKGEGAAVCTDGSAGDDGTPGLEGIGATGTGTLGPEGYTGVSGGDGQKGKTAQGGGGGGGTKGMAVCMLEALKGGAAGGSGGSGGCAGRGGKGGAAGGASIGILSLGAELRFEGVKITAAGGGKGGKGGAGQAGGMGGASGKGGAAKGAPATILGCNGGVGGKGGDGGKGGGGLGGHSLGIAYKGEAPETKGAMITAGSAGTGGTGEGDMGNGAPGVAEMLQAF